MANEVESRLLLVSVFLVAAAGLVYELIAGTVATYLLGSSITVFSMVIGVFLAAMGLGGAPSGGSGSEKCFGSRWPGSVFKVL